MNRGRWNGYNERLLEGASYDKYRLCMKFCVLIMWCEDRVPKSQDWLQSKEDPSHFQMSDQPVTLHSSLQQDRLSIIPASLLGVHTKSLLLRVLLSYSAAVYYGAQAILELPTPASTLRVPEWQVCSFLLICSKLSFWKYFRGSGNSGFRNLIS